ncbi:cupredoxin domain-containing protein [Marinobacteraceae bacterium S3BR75-40.1]
MTAKTLLTAAAFLITVSGTTLASGNHAGGHHGGGHHGAAVGEPGKAAEVDRTIIVVMKDNYYQPENITVQRGETIRFKVKNQGNLVHEFNIGTHAMHQNHQQEMQRMVSQGIIRGGELHHEMMKSHGMQHNDPNSILLEPDESGEIIWRFTADSDLQFACNIPGHYQSGMVGEIETR